MAPLPYDTQTITGYDDNPPPDDGSQSEENRVKWETIKEKLADPLHTTIESINTELLTAFAKMLGGGGTASTSIAAAVGASDQGKLYLVTGAGGITVTTPDAAGTGIGSPFWFVFLNTASAAVTLDGSGAQTINGSASISVAPGQGYIVCTDGTNWFAVGAGSTLVGAQMGHGFILNATVTESNSSNAATFAVKTLAGNDPSATDPVLVAFPSVSGNGGGYVFRTVTAALSLTISSGSTLGIANATAFEVWLVLFDDAGTIRLGAINPRRRSDDTHYPLAQIQPSASSTTEGGAGGADSTKTFYTGTAVSSKAYVILGVASYSSGLVTAGTWNVSPTWIQLYGPNVPPPNAAKMSNTTGGVQGANTAKAYVYFQTNGGGAVTVLGSFNTTGVATQTVSGSAGFRWSFANALSSQAYTAVIMARGIGSLATYSGIADNKGTSAFDFIIATGAVATQASVDINILVFENVP